MNLAQYVKRHKRFVAAHRGSSGTAPENTLEAFRIAIACGAAMVEADIQITKDLQPIVYHDDSLGRTVAGNQLICDVNYEDIKHLSAGKWYSDEYNSEKIPLLSEVIELIDNKAFLGLEIKSSINNSNNLEKIIKLVKQHNYIEKTIFASFDYNALAELKMIEPSCHVAAVNIPGSSVMPSYLIEKYGIEAFICSIDEVSQEIIDDINEANILLGAYSVDTKELFDKSMKLPIRAIGTNYPCMMTKLLAEHTNE